MNRSRRQQGRKVDVTVVRITRMSNVNVDYDVTVVIQPGDGVVHLASGSTRRAS
ncbi:MAG: hypothetical protein WD205_03485 [Rhodothermales bacterium]